jgi:hypothetical protein
MPVLAGEEDEAECAHQTKSIKLSDGTVATIRMPCGRDLVRAQDIASGENKFKFTCAMLAQVVELNGEPCVMEDIIMELWAADIDLLSREAAGDFLSSGAPSSPSSSNGAFGYSELMEMKLPEIARWYDAVAGIQRKRGDACSG